MGTAAVGCFRAKLESPFAARSALYRNQMERETGIEPATNGLGSRDSTTELLPPFLLLFRDPSTSLGISAAGSRLRFRSDSRPQNASSYSRTGSRSSREYHSGSNNGNGRCR